MPEKLPPPLTLAMVVCDAIWTDQTSRKTTLLGIFSEIESTSFPLRHPLMAVHISMTDAHGTVPIEVRLVDADEADDPLFKVEREVDFPDRRAIINVNIQVPDIVFPLPGEYRVQLFGSGEFLMERRIVVR